MNSSSTTFRVHPLFSDHAVLQQGRTNRVWGWGKPGATVTLNFLGRNTSTFVEQYGSWKIDVPPLEAQTGVALTLTSDGEILEIRDLAIGEVWLCSGQSNMEWPMQFAQLSDYIDGEDEPLPKCHSPWSELREAQTSILRLPRTGLAITRDVGDAYDIHPRNKQAVGFRLALQALKNLYGLNLLADGPKLENTRTDRGKIILKFANVEKGLRTKNGGPLLGFVVGDAKGAFFPGQARITAPDTVEIDSPDGMEAVSVRYAWAAFSLANLENSEGLPAAPFRTEIPLQA